ncbi:hypothetical protein EIB18_13040 [Caulobacter vibrioides]|nr:hypothetical protein [Caulobacter vibrioides]YP_002517917.1 hypothetical protein CCNA_02544 [Caulobacter vibrioides NA1000]ACL96009.1 hypothetical protein CCNA_02544 [Caulobacter vibrioides NA1000]ATC25447.1 hypothetical protein CA608_13375 [Caulobacter vibrioides]ATC29313.1 hypothetical protein CA607_13335 [Caulobacter vibrioides]AZH13542.1 hypothetical protein EIB18_13040 [Caulobacter vibrioides]PLR14408.1 hypothetical protein CVUC_04330 [Caulobacter vibrioides]
MHPMREGSMRARLRARRRPYSAGWLALALVACVSLFWLGARLEGDPSGGLSTAAVLAAFVALCVGPVVLTVTVIRGGFAFFRWFWFGESP